MPLTPAALESTYWKLYTNSKRLAWDPAAIDLSRDREQWHAIQRDFVTERYAEQIFRLCSLFAAGEESVTMTLAPFLGAIPRAGLGVEHEFHLTAQVYEEAKHYEFFARYFREVFGEDPAAAQAQVTPAPQAVLVDDLDAVADRLRRSEGRESVREAYVEAVTHYMGVVEAMLARTGYVGAQDALASRGWLPGLQEGFRLIRRDEGRHVSYGIHAIADLCAETPAYAQIVQATFEKHLPNVLATVQGFAEYEHPIVDVAKLIEFSLSAYQQFMGAAGLGDGADAADLLEETRTE
jgi:ribonucleoside-diphosphate reductase beta chain